MSDGTMFKKHPLQVVTTCRLRDLPILEVTVQKLFQTINVRSLYVIVPDKDSKRISSALGNLATVIPEDEFVPGMTMAELKKHSQPYFPQDAGWYFQQFLKLQFSFYEPEEEYYLIWDADTVPLRAMLFFDNEGRMLFTKAIEYHAPYFDTYQRILQEPHNREFSFIAQHMVVQKSTAQEMLKRINHSNTSEKGWAWNVIRNLPVEGRNLFSEYETYGHYMKNHYPDRIRIVERNWLREGGEYTEGCVPSARQMEQFSKLYDYVAFERVKRRWVAYRNFLIKQVVPQGLLPS